MHFQSIKSQLALISIVFLFAPALFAGSTTGLDLTNAQRAWLQAHPVVRLASDIAWPPFEWVDGDKQYQGIAADYVRLIEEKLGIQFELEKDKPWPEVVEAMKNRKLDVFSCVAKNPQREAYVTFTRPYLSFPMVIITTDEISYVDGINDLKLFYVGVVKGYATHEFLQANHPEIKLKLVNTTEEGLEAVSQGRINAFVDNIATATTIIQKAGLTNLKISGEMPIRYELSMAVRNDWPEFVDILQRALDSISDAQRQNIHNKWIAVRYEHGFDYSLFWKSASIFVLIAGLLYLYNRRLTREVKQRKVAEVEAMKAKSEADKANQAKSEFLAVMSHELRTPLTSIKGSLGLLSKGAIAEIPERAQGMLRIAYENSDRLSMLIDDILDIEKLIAGKISFHKDLIEVGELIAKAVTANQGYADMYGVHFKIDKSECDKCTINADESRLLQVISNFISNAIKYSPKDGVVRVASECNGHKVRIFVIDQGEGVPSEFHSRIFTHFSQADSSDTRAKGGSGLGLAISKEIIEQHNGAIGFENRAGEGACFYFELEIMGSS